ncbi:MAG: hypothetical protein JWL82_294 [Parcubacteria group bacterium]|nr:hypothetical protein [Parcubacteria group bacterium]
MALDEEKVDKNFEKVKLEAEEWYASVDEVECPYFNDTVAFNKKGITHIKFKKDKVARDRADQFMRLKHIRFAQRILEKSKTLQEYGEDRRLEEQKAEGKKELMLQDVKYYGFVAIIKDDFGLKRLKIIVKQVGGGKPYFWSIIPFWKRNKELKLHAGDLEED